jgi:hypothetical protein
VLIAVAVSATVAMAGNAHADHGAVDIEPDNTAIAGAATNVTIDFEGGTIIQCDTGTVSGTTDLEAIDVVNFELEFFGNCNVSGLGANFTCSDASGPNDELGSARWHADRQHG